MNYIKLLHLFHNFLYRLFFDDSNYLKFKEVALSIRIGMALALLISRNKE